MASAATGTAPRFGVILVPYTGALEGRTPRWKELATAAQEAEDAGFDSVWVPDHLMFRRESEVGGSWESGSLLAALGAATTSVTLGSAVIATAFRNPAMLAKIASTIDEITDGRFVLGIGGGWNEAEFSAFGYPRDNRYSRFVEALEIITSLLRTGYVDFQGRFYEAPDCHLEPRRPGAGPPIMVGSLSPKMMELAARHADVWNAWLPRGGIGSPADSSPEALEPFLRRLDEICRRVGRDPATLSRTAAVAVATDPERTGLVAQWGRVISGSPAEIAEQIGAFTRLGIDELMVAIDPPGPAGIERMRAVLDEF